MERFVAIDVETANERLASICSVGLARFDHGEVTDELYTVIDPHEEFSGMNILIHGIHPEDVQGAPTFAEVLPKLIEFVGAAPVIHHTHFDRTAVRQAASQWNIQAPQWEWIDSARVTRRVWPDRRKRGYGLMPVCEMIGYDFEHHHALEDAKAAGHVILAALEKVGTDIPLTAMLDINPTARSRERFAGQATGEGPLDGEVVVFTGTLVIQRREASALARGLGCTVAANVTRESTLVVVGDQDLNKLAGAERSSKHRRAEALIADGYDIRILSEADFIAMLPENG